MRILKNFVTPLHKQTKRNYVERMTNNKIYCSEVAKKYSKEYWDGDRKFGYGGYKYIPGRWKPVAEKLIKTYKLDSKSKIETKNQEEKKKISKETNEQDRIVKKLIDEIR